MNARPHPASTLLWISFAALAIAVIGTIWLAARQQQAFQSVAHTLKVESLLRQTLSFLQDAETGQRGYLLTGNSEFLQPYEESSARISQAIAGLQATVADNNNQQVALARLRTIAATRQDLLREGIERRQRGDPIDGARLQAGKSLMDDMRGIVASMLAEEDRLLTARTSTAERDALLVMGGLILSAALVFVLAMLAMQDAGRRLRDIAQARDALTVANARLMQEAATREAAEAQVRQLQKMEAIGQLTGGIAHDFNNMLAIIIGSLDMAKRRLGLHDEGRIKGYLDNAWDGATRAAQLTSRLLAFSRQQALMPQPLDLNRLVGGMSDLLRRSVGEKIEIESVTAGGLWRCHADPAQLEQTILNLCINARDAMPDGGKLTIETSNSSLDEAYAAAAQEVEPGQFVMLSVTDTGAGMSAAVAARAFDPFYTTKPTGKGTGLGLSQVHGFVKQSKGHVKIYSEPGNGTTVKVYLPRYYDDARESWSATTATAGDSELLRARGEEIVLVVEDDASVRQVSVDALRDLGYAVVHTGRPAEALDLLAGEQRFDLLFTDVVLPDMNGRQLAERARERRPDLRVLYTTGYTRNAVVHNGVLDPNVNFLQKPFTIAQLAVRVRRVLDSR